MATPKTQRQDLLTVLGKSGVQMLQGIISQEEYNKDLIGQTGLDTFEKMRKSDGTVRASLLAVKLPIITAKWDVERGGDTDDDKRAQDFIREQLFERMSWKETLRESMTFFEFGFSVGELVFDMCDYDGQEYIGLSGIEGRKQKTIYSFELKDKTPGVQQLAPGSDPAEIPMEKLLLLTNEKEGDNYAGVSLLRAAYRHWYLKDTIYRVDAIAIERQGLGVPKLKTPKAGNPQDDEKARELARNIRANEEAFLELPEGYELEFMDMKGNSTVSTKETLAHHDRQIMKNVMAQFFELGSQGSSGSYNLSVDQSSLFLDSLGAAADMIAEAYTRQVVKRLTDLNGFTLSKPLKVTHSNIGHDNLEVVGTQIARMVQVGAITMDPELEQWLRELFGAPKLPKDIKDDYGSRPPPAPSAPLPPDPPKPVPVETSASAIEAARKERDEIDKQLGITSAD